MKKKLFKELLYDNVIFLLRFNFFKSILKYFFHAYLMDRGYSLNYGYLIDE